MIERYKPFPPGDEQLRVPTSSRRAALAGLSLYPGCRRRAVWALRAAWAAVALFGPRVLPGHTSSWQPPMDGELWRELTEKWFTELGAFDTLAIHTRRQASRPGLALLLLRHGSPVAFVKLRIRAEGAESIGHEARALSMVWEFQPRSFTVPAPLMRGEVHEWHYFATAPMPLCLHYPPEDPPLDLVLQETESALLDLPRPSRVPDHWRPMHGDFAPWNLRQFGRSELILIDWERAGWGPPHADAVLYRATEAALSGKATARATVDELEAVSFWKRQVRNRPVTDADSRFTAALDRTLCGMEVLA
jgi:hypothetical protein